METDKANRQEKMIEKAYKLITFMNTHSDGFSMEHFYKE
jgi:hypothetical protein